jgi:phospholipid-transporting ATPase
MASGRPPGSHPSAGREDDLLQLEEHNPPTYNSGQRPPVNDDRLLQQYNINDSEQPRPSVSYDDFVGSARPAGAAHGGPGDSGLHPNPYLGGEAHRTYSQTSGLDNFQRYSDLDDYEDEHMHGYYNGDPDEENVSSGRIRTANERNSILALGGGLMGKAKNMLGMAPGYSEMDLPLTEAGARRPDDADADGDGNSSRRGKKKFSPPSFRFGRRKIDPATLGPRMIMLNNAPANSSHKFVDNHISTAKYNIVTFLPKFFYEQFSKYANLFFLFTAGLQQIPNVTPTNRYTTIVPLCIVLLVSAIKELVEDNKRRASDQQLNYSKAQVLKGSTFQETKWLDVAVGDIVRVESEEPFPADLVLLASSEPEGLCYIETANLDGETNLKIKQAVPETAHLVSPSDLSRLSGRLRSEQPNSSLYTYEATLTMHAGGGEKELPLSPEQLLLRGATLRNTPWIHGIVVFTGHETKLMRNATATPIKRTAVERTVNLQILMLVGILIGLSVITSVGDLIIRQTASSKLTYLDYGDSQVAKQFFMDIATNWVLFSNLVPISLFVTIEIVKYFQAFLINSDLDIYYDKTDTPATCRTSSLVEELGQIEYIFSDKTGTLTCNIMEFKQVSIGGIQYAGEVPEDRRATVEDGMEIGIHDFKELRANLESHPTSSTIHHFLTLLSTCHTVIPERKDEKPGEIKYQAASPDEGALVEGAVTLGYQFTNRKPRSVQIMVDGQELEYELLAVCEFNSTRKRMSTVFRCPDGKVRVYCKGADTVILERLHPDNPTVEVTLQHLEEYASDGLRTLCLAMREVPEDEFQQWIQIHEKAATTVSGNRQEELDKVSELIEKDFYLLGATAIEDRLQDGVPDTIHTLQQAGIKIWVLTGDRQETAINIGMSCKLISEDMTLLIINEESAAATRENLTKKLSAVHSQLATGGEMEPLALIIDGKSLTYALEKDMEKLLLDLAVLCKAVLCW